MRKIILGIVTTAAIASPLAAATSAQAANNLSTDPACTPKAEIFAAPAVTHPEYKWTPVKSNAGPTQWTLDNPAANTHRDFTVKGAPVDYFRDGTKSQVVIDAPAVQAVDGVTCVIALPVNPLPRTGVSASTVIPTPEGTDKYSFSAVTNHINLNGKIGTTVTAKPGYVFPGGLTSKVYAVVVDNSGHLFFSQDGTPQEGRHINLADEFSIEHSADGFAGYYSTQIKVTVVNDTTTAKEFRIRYADQQDGNRVWIERAIFTDGTPGSVIEPGNSRVMTFDVWYDAPVASGSDVPDDLVMDFGFELA